MVKRAVCFLWAFLLCGVWINAAPVQAQYLKEGQYNKVPTRKLPERVNLKIRALAEKRYPDNAGLQQNTIDLQTRSYFKVKGYKADGIPSQELLMIKRNAVRDYPNDYVRQLVNIDKQVKRYLSKNTRPAAKKAVVPVSAKQ